MSKKLMLLSVIVLSWGAISTARSGHEEEARRRSAIELPAAKKIEGGPLRGETAEPAKPDESRACLVIRENRVVCGVGDEKTCKESQGARFLFRRDCGDPYFRLWAPGKTGACVQVNRKGKRIGCVDRMEIWETVPSSVMRQAGFLPASDRACYNGSIRFNFNVFTSPVGFLLGKSCKDVPKNESLPAELLETTGKPHHPAYYLSYLNFKRLAQGKRPLDVNWKPIRTSRRGARKLAE